MGEVVVRLDYPRPSPRSAVLPIEAVDAHRDIWCRHYDGCLDVAVRRDWSSWSCASCPLRWTEQEKPELRARMHSPLGIARDEGYEREVGSPLGLRGGGRPPAMWLYNRLTDKPRRIEELAGPYQIYRTQESLLRLAHQGVAEWVDGGWRRTGKKTCTSCKQTKPLDQFAASTKNTAGCLSYCRACGARAARMRRTKKRAEGST